MNSKLARFFLVSTAAVAIAFTGCSGGGSPVSFGAGSSGGGSVDTIVSDAPANDWATIGVKVLSIALNPVGGGTPVTIFTAPSPVPTINLVQLDQLGELLGNSNVPAGTYSSATLTLSANPGDVSLISSDDPDTGFAWSPNTPVPASQIQIQGTSGSAGSLTVPLSVNFVSNLVVTSNSSNQLDLEFDLSHPAFIVAHSPSATSTAQTVFAINFNGPWVHHHPIGDITHFLLRDIYGTVSSVSGDGSSMTITKDYPVEPPTNPETAIASSQSLTIKADTNSNVGMLFYNLDVSHTPQTIFSFSTVSSVLTAGEFVRVAARYQTDGRYAVRIWASSSFDKIWQNPEGHVLHVNTTTNVISVTTEADNPGFTGGASANLNRQVTGANHVDLQVTAATKFYFRAPASDTSDSEVIGTGTAFLSNVKRGFKVHVLADPTTSPLPDAVTVDIEVARFDGQISNATTSPVTGGFDYSRAFATAVDSYKNFFLNYISSSTTNGNDPLSGTAILGFKWWYFTFPTVVTSNVTDTSEAQAITDFASAVNGSVNFGNALVLPAYGESYAVWGDPNNTTGWSAPWAVLVPSPVPLGSIQVGYSAGSFTMVAPPAPVTTQTPVTVDVSTTAGSATLLYVVNRTAAGIVTISPGSTSGLTAGTLVKIAGVPESNGHLKAYTILYYTGAVPPAS